jgi:hypothetical protein
VNRIERGAIRAGDQEALSAVHDAGGDFGNLSGRFSGAEDDLGETLPEGAMVVDAGDADILEERRLAQEL